MRIRQRTNEAVVAGRSAHTHTHTHTHPHTPTHTPTHTHTHTRPKALSIPETSLIATVFTISVYTAVHVIISF